MGAQDEFYCASVTRNGDDGTRQRALAATAPRRVPRSAHGRLDRRTRHHGDLVLLRHGHHQDPARSFRRVEAHRAQPDRELHDLHARRAVQRHRAGDAGHPLRDLRVHRPGAPSEGTPVRADARSVRAAPLRRRDALLLLRAVAERAEVPRQLRWRGHREPAARVRIHIVQRTWLTRQRRYVFLLVFVAAAIITPTPDPFNQTIVAIPMYLLWELGLFLARFA